MRSVGGILEDALATIVGERISVTGAGRTDAGVHATGQVISLTLPREFSPERLALAMGARLPRDVSLRDVAPVPQQFSARRSARSRTYVYAILNRREGSALLARYTWHVRRELDLAAMNVAAAHLLGEHNFRSFCALPENGTTVRTVSAIALERHGDFVRLAITADAFLHHMVRTIVGTLVECGHGRRDPGSFPAALNARDRAAAGVNAPARGLYLASVRYDDYDSYREPWVFKSALE